MKDFTIKINCEGYNFVAHFDEKDNIKIEPNLITLNLSPKEIDKIIDKLNDFKLIMRYEKNKA